MPQSTNKWVFTELVKDPDNLQQLLSYAIYKKFKDEIARTARHSGKNEARIEEELVHYHDQCLSSQQTLDMFREKAADILAGYTTDVNSRLQSSLVHNFNKQHKAKENEIKVLKKKLENAESIALKKFAEGANDYAKKITKPKGLLWVRYHLWNFIKFLFSGVPKFIATTVSMGFLVAVVTFANGDANAVVRTALTKLVDLVAPAKPNDSPATQVGRNTSDVTNSKPDS